MPNNRDELLARMAPIIEEQIGRRDTKHAVFRGCIDWHSAVHGHWALLRIARTVKGFEGGAELANGSMEKRAMAQEATLLVEQPDFEMPYGRAWFLALARDFELWSGEDRLRAMGDAVAASLRAHYRERAPSVSSYEYANASWVFAQLYDWYAFVESSAGLDYVRASVTQAFAEPPVKRFAEDDALEQFFSPAGNWLYLIAKAAPAALAEAIAAAGLGDDKALRPVAELPRSAHGLGMNWSRAWCLAALARGTGEARFASAFEAHVAAGMRHHEVKGADVWAYRHWVPQFAVYALTEEA